MEQQLDGVSWQSERERERQRGSEEGGKGERARYFAKVERGERKKIQKRKEEKKEREYRRTATRPDRPVAQAAHVYLALLHRAPRCIFEVLIDEFLLQR